MLSNRLLAQLGLERRVRVGLHVQFGACDPCSRCMLSNGLLAQLGLERHVEVGLRVQFGACNPCSRCCVCRPNWSVLSAWRQTAPEARIPQTVRTGFLSFRSSWDASKSLAQSNCIGYTELILKTLGPCVKKVCYNTFKNRLAFWNEKRHLLNIWEVNALELLRYISARIMAKGLLI